MTIKNQKGSSTNKHNSQIKPPQILPNNKKNNQPPNKPINKNTKKLNTTKPTTEKVYKSITNLTKKN